MMLSKTLYDDGNLKWIAFGRDPERSDVVIDTNEYAIICNDEVIVLDPGGAEIFPYVLSALSEHVDVSKIKSFMASHQDPDIFSSLPLWKAICPDAKIFMPWLWKSFMSHFGKDYVDSFVGVPDEGMSIKLGPIDLEILPAHFLHSSGNLNLYCPQSGILFCGDIGSALVGQDYPFYVEDFEDHIQYMQTFHQRWMPSNEAKNEWVRRVRRLSPKFLCPQHGAVFTNENVGKFLDWFEALEVGKVQI